MGGRGANVSIASKATSEPTTSKVITAAAGEEPKKKKNSLSEMFKKRKAKDIEFFSGDTEWRSNKYFKFDHVKDNDNIVIVTKNIKAIKGNFVMIVDNDKAIYLKDWQVKQVHNYGENFWGWAVKLNRKYFKPYTFKKPFDDYSFDKQDTFDSLLKDAKKQNKTYIALDKSQEFEKRMFLNGYTYY